jgi:CheY-like chemotaxis protein
VYGIVQQSGGFVWVYSEPRRGSTFKIYLPAVSDAAGGPVPAAPALAEPVTRAGGETILFVEDEAALRDVGVEILRRQGYMVLVAASGDEALTLWRDHPGRIDLIATDVVMPGLGGPLLVERVRALDPHVKVLFMSGYIDAGVVHHDVSTQGGAFLHKPFGAVALTRKVREVLG